MQTEPPGQGEFISHSFIGSHSFPSYPFIQTQVPTPSASTVQVARSMTQWVSPQSNQPLSDREREDRRFPLLSSCPCPEERRVVSWMNFPLLSSCPCPEKRRMVSSWMNFPPAVPAVVVLASIAPKLTERTTRNILVEEPSIRSRRMSKTRWILLPLNTIVVK